MTEGKFNPSEHLRQLQGKDYLDVKWRLVWFHQETGPKAGYITVETAHDLDKGFAKFFTIAWDGNGDEWRQVKLQGIEIDVCGRVATGEGSETKSDFKDYIEKAATKSVGRALGGLGFGTQFSELDENDGIADSPVERKQPSQQQRPVQQQRSQTTPVKPAAQPQQKPQPAPAQPPAPINPINQRALLWDMAVPLGYDKDGFNDLLQQYTFDGKVQLRDVKEHLEREQAQRKSS